MSTTEYKNKAGPGSKVCDNCSAPEGSDCASKLSACGRCGLVVYCSKDCQRAHWKVNHKQRCIQGERQVKVYRPENLDL